MSGGVEKAIEFFSKIRTYVDGKSGSQRLVVDLVNTEGLDLGAALVLVAEFDRWQRLHYILLVPETVGNWYPAVRKELNALGFFKLLKTKLPAALKSAPGPAWIQFVSDKLTVGKAAKLLRGRLERELRGSTGYDQQIYIALVEAMKNAFQHAYPDDLKATKFDSRIDKRWWMAASIDEDRRSIEVAFLDLGITIPGSLPFSWLWKHLTSEARMGSDVNQIIEALRYGHSRLGEAHRGKGFTNILYPTSLHKDNYVSILSGRGLCYVGQQGEWFGIETPERFAGTLIRWKLTLDR